MQEEIYEYGKLEEKRASVLAGCSVVPVRNYADKIYFDGQCRAVYDCCTASENQFLLSVAAVIRNCIALGKDLPR